MQTRSFLPRLLPFIGCQAFLVAGLAAQTPIPLLNPGFETLTGNVPSDWQLADGAGTNSSPSNYASPIPNLTPNVTLQIKSDGQNRIQQSLVQTGGGSPVTADSFGNYSVSFQYGYRRDAVRNGDHVIRVSLWNVTDDLELAGSDLLITDPGSLGANSLSSALIGLSYDNTNAAWAGDTVAIRFTSTSGDLAANSWQRTAILDNVSMIGGIADPILQASSPYTLTSNGIPQAYSVTIHNQGALNDLVITDVTPAGADAAAISNAMPPSAIAPGTDGQIAFTFTPNHGGGNYTADLQVTSNDALTPVKTLVVNFQVHDPEIVPIADSMNFGSLPANPGPQILPFTITNNGGTQDLTVTGATIQGGFPSRFSVLSTPSPIPPGQSDIVYVQFDPGSEGGAFADRLAIATNDPYTPVVNVTLTAEVAIDTMGGALGLTNGNFDAGGWNSSTGGTPAGWASSLAATNTAGNYGQGGGADLNNTPNLTSIAAHLQAVGGNFYQQALDGANPGLTASGLDTLTVTLDAGYRNDASTNGPITLRVSLWNLATDTEISGRNLVIADTGVLAGTAANILTPHTIKLASPSTTFTNEALALRIRQVGPALGTNSPWSATAIVDNVTLHFEGAWTPSPFALWAANAGLAAGSNAPGDDPDHDGKTNLYEFAFGGSPLAPESSGYEEGGTADTTGDSQQELILTLAVRTGAVFGSGPSPSATFDGITYTIQGSMDLADFTAAVEGPVTPAIVPASWPSTPPEDYEYVTFRLTGSNGLPDRGFLRAKAVTTP